MADPRNQALLALSAVWVLDGDLMRCRSCHRSLIASRESESLRHAVTCRFGDRIHPWQELREALDIPSDQPTGYNADPVEGNRQ